MMVCRRVANYLLRPVSCTGERELVPYAGWAGPHVELTATRSMVTSLIGQVLLPAETYFWCTSLNSLVFVFYFSFLCVCVLNGGVLAIVLFILGFSCLERLRIGGER